jgi:Na+/proline symporter
MGIGGGIFLLVLGAILAFAVDFRVSGIELSTIGWICMAAGLLTIILSLVLSQRRTTAQTVVQHSAQPQVAPPVAQNGETVVREERRDGI